MQWATVACSTSFGRCYWDPLSGLKVYHIVPIHGRCPSSGSAKLVLQVFSLVYFELPVSCLWQLSVGLNLTIWKFLFLRVILGPDIWVDKCTAWEQEKPKVCGQFVLLYFSGYKRLSFPANTRFKKIRCVLIHGKIMVISAAQGVHVCVAMPPGASVKPLWACH